MSTVLERVRQGAAVLDEKFGPEWVEKVNTDELNLAGMYSCVLGQVYGDYFGGRQILWPDEFDRQELAAEHGFDVTENAGSYSYLKRMWLKVIGERRSA